MRDHYEGTPLDISRDFGAGPYHTPYRLSPLSFKVGDKEYFNERPISTQQSGFVFVAQMRSTLPDAIGGVLVVWYGRCQHDCIYSRILLYGQSSRMLFARGRCRLYHFLMELLLSGFSTGSPIWYILAMT